MKKLIVIAVLAAVVLCSCSCGGGASPSDMTTAANQSSSVKTAAKQSEPINTEPESTETHIVRDSDKAIVGKWVAETITTDGKSESATEKLPPDTCYIKIHGDGTANVANESVMSTARYTFDGKTLKMTALNTDREYVYENGKLSLSYKGKTGKKITIVYVKQ